MAASTRRAYHATMDALPYVAWGVVVGFVLGRAWCMLPRWYMPPDKIDSLIATTADARKALRKSNQAIAVLIEHVEPAIALHALGITADDMRQYRETGHVPPNLAR